MNFTYTDDQQLLMTAFEGLLEPHMTPPQGVHGYAAYSDALQTELRDGGFMEIAVQDGFGPLEAAMLVEAAARCPVSVEAAATMLVGPLIEDISGPIALGWSAAKPIRYLARARTLCLFDGDDVMVGPVPEYDVLATVAAYPMGRLRRKPDGLMRIIGAKAEAIHRRALIGLAAEAAGLMRGALDNTVAYVKERQQFGQPLGHFQAIQHRLAECAQIVEASRLMALRAADQDCIRLAAIACLYAQETMRKVITDCHQFSGAMGLTLEFPLHLWTYRLKVLQGEAGGRAVQGALVAARTWMPVRAGEQMKGAA